MSKKLYCYSRPNVMTDHNYSDDVALCEAGSLIEAVNIFSAMYDKELLEGHVTEVKYNNYGIYIATDY